MPPKFKLTKQQIIDSAVNLTSKIGFEQVTARSLAKQLGTSSKTIFGQFKNMEELKTNVINQIRTIQQNYIDNEIATQKYPVFKAIGMGYIRFSLEQKQLFKVLYMRDRTSEQDSQEDLAQINNIIKIIQQQTKVSEQTARLFHLEIWMFIHGIATTIATSYLEWDMELVSKLLTDEYEALKKQLIGDKE